MYAFILRWRIVMVFVFWGKKKKKKEASLIMGESYTYLLEEKIFGVHLKNKLV